MLIRVFVNSIIGVLAIHLASAEPLPVKTNSRVITSVDVEDVLTNSLKLNRARRLAEDSACPGGGGSGMRAKRYCYWNIEFRDLSVSKIIRIELGNVELSTIPAFY